MNTPETDPVVQCYCCGASALRSAMQNLKGHDACPPCVAAVLHPGAVGPPDYALGYVKPEDLEPGDGFQYRKMDGEWSKPYKFVERGPHNSIRATGLDGVIFSIHNSHLLRRTKFSAPAPITGFIDPAFSGADKSVEGIMYIGPMKPGPDPKGVAGLLKAQLQLIPPALNVEVAKALKCGAAKYGPWNWRADRVEVMTYIGAMRRHIDAFLNGEDTDPDSGTHHLGCVAASAAIVLDAAAFGSLIDNRPSALRLELCPTTGMPVAELKNEFNPKCLEQMRKQNEAIIASATAAAKVGVKLPNYGFTGVDVKHMANQEILVNCVMCGGPFTRRTDEPRIVCLACVTPTSGPPGTSAAE